MLGLGWVGGDCGSLNFLKYIMCWETNTCVTNVENRFQFTATTTTETSGTPVPTVNPIPSYTAQESISICILLVVPNIFIINWQKFKVTWLGFVVGMYNAKDDDI